jgi:hypothetical protein
MRLETRRPRQSADGSPPGFRLATTDPKQIADWWIRWPDALIGSPVPSHLVCLDVDPRKGGSIEALEALANEPLNATEFVMSGRGNGGVHLFYHRPKGYISSTYLRRVAPESTSRSTPATPSSPIAASGFRHAIPMGQL